MKKRILSILLLCCMVLTLLPTTAFATGELRDSTNVTVTFDSDGGSAVEPQSVPQGQLVQRPADPIKDGHTFIGWYNKADLQYINLPEWNFDYPVFENMELVAQWMEARPISTEPITYLDKDGNQQVCNKYTVLTSETKESILNYDDKWYDLPAGWYVVEGNVTITPRLDTHGAVNLILTNGSHLTAEWGIDVKVGDTFTVYAQSTDEGTMGRLTACLPADFNLDRMVDYSVWPYSGMAGIGSSARWREGNDGIRESEGTIVINGGNIRAKGQDNASAIGGTRAEEIEFRSTDRGEVYNRRQGGSITINGGVVRTEPFALPEGNPLAVDSVGIGTCQMGYGGSVTINGGTVIAEAANDAITTGYGGTITINGGDVTARGGVNNFGENSHRVLSGNGIGPYESGSVIINGGTVKATAKGNGFGIGGARIYNTGAMTVTINEGTIEATANRNNAAIGDKGKGESGVTINGGVIHAVGKGSAAGIGSMGDIRITGGELTVSAEGSGAAIGGFTDSYSERVDCKSITINGDVIKSISSKDGACIGGAAGGSVGSITISDAELPLLSAEKILIGWGADSPGGKLTIRNCRVASTDTLSALTDGIRVGSNSEIVIEESEIRLPHLRGIRVGGNGSIAVRDSDLHTYGIFMDETVHTITDAKTLKKLEITDSSVLTGDIIGARGEYSSVEEVVIRGSSIRLNEEYTYNYCTIGGGTKGSFGSIDIQNSQIHIPSPGLNTAIGNGHQADFNRESHIRIANSQVFVGGAKFGPAIGAAYGSSGGQINILIENSTVTAKGGNLRSDTDYIPGIGKNSSGRASEIGKIQILNSTVESFRLTEKGGTDYVYDDLHKKDLPGIPAENISICGSTVNGTRIDHSPDEYGKCALCGKYDLGYCYEHGLLTMEGLTDCVSDGSEKKLTGLSHKTGENETKQLAENTDYTAGYSNNVHPYTLAPDDAGFDPAKAPKVTLYGTGNYCGKAEHYFTISTEAPAAEHTVTVRTDGNGTASASHAKAAAGTEITLTATPNEGYHFKEWEVMSGGVTIKDDKFTMPSANVEVKAIFKDMSKEQFTLAPGGRYYFDLSAMGIPGTVNGGLPDTKLHYVPFTYAGTIEAYKLTSAIATTKEYAEQNKYPHSLFVADYAVTHAVSWNGLNDEGLIFGKNYASGGVDYTLRAPSVGSDATGLGDSDPGVPQSNEWDTMLNKDSGYIQNWNEMFSWGQDTVSFDASRRAVRGYNSARHWLHSYATRSYSNHGFRPVLEVRNPNTLGPDGLKAVTLALGGGKLGGSSDAIHIIVKTGSEFTAPASDGLNRPDGNTGSYFMWLGSDGKLYAPGASVPADVTKLTAQFALSEQFSLKPGGRYYFDLSGEKIPGTANGNLPDSTLHYVPFTYAGTIEAYKLTSAMATTEEYAQQNKYAHSLFIADYNVTHTVSWDDLNTKSLIFGKNYASGGVDYTLRAPSVGSNSTGLGDSRRGVPQSNEWDAVLNKNSGYIQNWNKMYLWGQDVSSVDASYRARRGYSSARNWYSNSATGSNPSLGFRPVLEVLNAETLGSDRLKVVTLDLGGGTLGNSSEDIQIIVKTGSEFTAPASDGLTRPDGNTDNYFKWLGSDGELYAPDGSVPANVNKLTAQFAPDTYTVTIITEGGGTASASHAKAVAGTEITLTATPNEGYRFKEWQVISGGVTIKDDKFTMPSANVEVKAIFEEDAPPAPTEFTITVKTDGNGTASASHAKAVAGTEITLTATPNEGYRFKEWQVISGDVTIKDDKFTMPHGDVEVKAIFEEDAPPAPTDPAKPSISVTGTYTYNGSEHTATVSGYDPTTMDISGNTATDAGDYTVSVMSKTGKWADDSTDAVTATWKIGKATQEAPINLTGTAPTTEGGSDGKISGVDATMEYRAESEIYIACIGIEIENLPVGNYFVRYAGDNNHFASSDTVVTVGEGTPLADCTITFNAGDGSGSMASVTVKAGTNYTLPECGFTAPDDQEFKAWEIGGTEYKVGDSYTVNEHTEIKELWENSVITPTTYTVTVSNDGNGTGTATPSTAVAGTEIILTATPNTGYHFKEWQIMSGGVTIKDDKFLMPNDNVEVRAIFEEDAPPAPTEFTITVKTDGNGTASASLAKAAAGTEITLTATPKEGYHFKEWQVESPAGLVITNNQFTMPNDIVEVKAIFEKDAPPAPTEFIVTVKTDGNGTASASLAKAAAGTTIILTATPNTGYHFKEWKVMSGGVTIKDDKFIMPSTNVEVKAIFEKDAPPAPTEFTVIFDGNGGTPSVGSMTTTNQKLTSLPSASRSGSYSFDGWYTEKSGGTKITTATVFSAKTTVYAHWTYTGGGGGGYNPPFTYYTLRFETGGGSDIPSVRESYNTYIDLTKYVPTWRGHTFIGWYTERSLTNKVSGVYLTKDMTVYALWRVDENPGTGANPFTDVSEKDWFYGDVMFVYENGLMLGTSKTLFSPHGTATRGMMATILWRMEGSPAPKGKNSFADVEAGKWYADAITWTAENGIFAGYGKDKFGPDDPITREQLAAIFYRYADYKGYDLTVKGNLDKFKDADKITDYAKTAMQWAVGSGLVKGKSGNLLDPQGTATRAEIAAMLHRFIEKYELVQGKAPGGLMGWIDPKRLQIPKTGDSSVLGLWGISLCTSLAGCLALTTWQIRRRREEEALQIIEK